MGREQPDRLLTTAEWSRQLGCSVRVILYAIHTNKLLAKRSRFKRGHPFVIKARDIQHWLDGVEQV